MKAFQFALFVLTPRMICGKCWMVQLEMTILNAKGQTVMTVGLCWFSGGSRNFYNNKKEVKSPSDLDGLKLRVNTDPMIKLVSMNGGTPVNIAYNDIYKCN